MNHLMIDAYGADEGRLDSLNNVYNFLSAITSALHLDVVTPPNLTPYYYAKDINDDGISAFCLLIGGHITIHTFPRRKCMFADILYDGYFDENNATNIIKTFFSYESIKLLRTERRYLDTTIDEDKKYNGKAEFDFGPHTIAKIEDVDISFEQIFDMLDELPELINMKKISRPLVIKSTQNNPDYISGIVLIAQSHIAFHYSIKEKTLFCDAFSCSFFRIEKFVDYLNERIGKGINMTLIRGSKHESKIASRDAKVIALNRWGDISRGNKK